MKPSGGGVEDEDAVGEDERLVDAVGDENDSRTGARPYCQEILLQLLTCLRVERAEWLIHEDENGLAHQRARDADPLLHAAGQFVRKVLGKGGKPHQLDEMPRHIAALGRAYAIDLERKLDVAEDGAPGQQAEIL